MGRRGGGAGEAAVWRAALYVRLSKETRRADDSDSVVNQQTLLTQALRKLEERFPEESFTLVDYYIDDGETGTDSDRESFRRLLDDVRSRKVNLVMFKDLSRLGRNYSEAGYYLDQFFVKYDVRYICLNNPYIDSRLTPDVANSPLVPIQNVFNDDFARTTSLKVREVFRSKREDGQFIGAFAPFGYKKDPRNKNALLIDEEAAAVVRDIYRWFTEEGMSKRGIALRLNELGIPSPAAYKRRNGLNYRNPRTAPSSDERWGPRTVYNILLNQVYIGNMVQGKQRVKSYKVHDRVAVPESDWTVVEGTHAPIINRETFDRAQSLHQRDTRTATGESEVHLLAGLVKCADCGKAMRRTRGKNSVYWFCRSYYDKKICTKRSISQKKLEGAIREAIRGQIGLVEDMGGIKAEAEKGPAGLDKGARIAALRKTRGQELERCRAMKTELYVDWKKGLIDRAEFSALRERFAREEEGLAQAITRLEAEGQAIAGESGPGEPDPGSLTRALLTELVNEIYIDRDGGVVVEFNYADQFLKIAEAAEGR